MNRSEAMTEYYRAQKQGQRAYRDALMRGRSPYLPVLDDILKNAAVETQEAVGLVEIPLEQVVGTKTTGRTAAFACNFMPLLAASTEFGAKWVSLFAAHVAEGIRDPVKVYEYRGLFYVQEGNKRVSVLKYVKAESIFANVIRVVPAWSDDPGVRVYYEFMDFYRLTGIYRLNFTQEGSCEKMQALLGKQPGEAWTDDDRTEVLSLYNWVKKAYYARGGAELAPTVGDVLLMLLKIYSAEELKQQTPAQLARSLDSIWDDVLALGKPDAVKVSTQPAAPAQAKLLERIIPAIRTNPEHLSVAFVHMRTPETSNWTNAHEFGRAQLDQVFGGKVKTRAYNGAEPGKNDDKLLEQAVADGADVIFTTSPQLVGASLRAAVRHPEVNILNCSMDMPYASIRTYYSRGYEAKFIAGAIAGAVAPGDTIGYIAGSPMFGEPANINAFALGASMVNPRARVELQWTCLPGEPMEVFSAKGITVISGRDTPQPGRPQHEFGVFQVRPGGVLQSLASPFWHWGQFYENVVRTILDGGWRMDKSGADGSVVNYWWGMSSGVIDMLFSRELPQGVRHLADILRAGIVSGAVDPFRCNIIAQSGEQKNEGMHGFTPEQLLHMDWLCANVDGFLPEYDQLTEEARPMYRMQGIHRDRLRPEKESVL